MLTDSHTGVTMDSLKDDGDSVSCGLTDAGIRIGVGQMPNDERPANQAEDLHQSGQHASRDGGGDKDGVPGCQHLRSEKATKRLPPARNRVKM